MVCSLKKFNRKEKVTDMVCRRNIIMLPKSKLEGPTYSSQVSQEQVWKNDGNWLS